MTEVARTTVAPDEPEPASDDLWERVERSVRGDEAESPAPDTLVAGQTRRVTVLAHPVERVLDPKAVARVQETVVGLLGRHGPKLEHLGASESILVALHLTGSSADLDYRAFALDDAEQNPFGSYVRAQNLLRAGRAQRQPPEQRIVLRVSRHSLDDRAAGRLDLDEFAADAVEVTAY